GVVGRLQDTMAGRGHRGDDRVDVFWPIHREADDLSRSDGLPGGAQFDAEPSLSISTVTCGTMPTIVLWCARHSLVHLVDLDAEQPIERQGALHVRDDDVHLREPARRR